jgi:hypothetical protein
MVGVKGKSGRHKKCCECERCKKNKTEAAIEQPKTGLELIE